MPAAGWTKPSAEHRLSDHLAFAMLGRVFPPDVVDIAIGEAGRAEQRTRLLPARLVVYYVLGLALFSRSSYEEVIRLLIAGRSWSSGWSVSRDVPTKAALFKARARLGSEPMQALFERVAQPLDPAGSEASGAPKWVLGLDRLSIDIPDTAQNVAEFGRGQPPTRPDSAAAPTVDVTGLTECSSGAIIAAMIGDPRDRADELSARVLSRLCPGALVVADRTLYSPAMWDAVAATGADLLWEVPDDAELPVAAPGADAIRLVARADGALPRLATTLADVPGARDDYLEDLFLTRRTLSSAFREFAVHADAPRVVLRSRLPDGVRQELYGFLCVHYAMRVLLAPTLGIAL